MFTYLKFGHQWHNMPLTVMPLVQHISLWPHTHRRIKASGAPIQCTLRGGPAIRPTLYETEHTERTSVSVLKFKIQSFSYYFRFYVRIFLYFVQVTLLYSIYKYRKR